MFALHAEQAKTANIYTFEIYPLYDKNRINQECFPTPSQFSLGLCCRVSLVERVPEQMLARLVEGVGVTVVYLRESVSALKYDGSTNGEKMSRVWCMRKKGCT